MAQLNRTCTLKKSLRVADVSEVVVKYLEENTLRTQSNNKEIVN